MGSERADTPIIPSDDGTSYIHNAIFDWAQPVLSPSTFVLLSMLLARVRNAPDLAVRASLAELGQWEGQQVLARNSVATGIRELSSLDIVAVDETPDGSTSMHTYRLTSVSEWDHAAIGRLLEKRGKAKDARSLIRNDPQWLALRQQVLERDKFTCQYCGQQGGKLHCDHVIPVARGGINDLSNLVTACERCNLSKNDKTPDEWHPC
jgi:HNH endonuclease